MTTIRTLVSSIERNSLSLAPGLDAAHRSLILTAQRDLRERPERVFDFLGLIGLRPEVEPFDPNPRNRWRRSLDFRWRYSLAALDRVLTEGGWRHVPAPGKLAWVARAVYLETLREKRRQAIQGRRWISDEMQVGLLRRYFVEQCGGEAALRQLATEGGVDVVPLFGEPQGKRKKTRALGKFRDVARKINGLRGLPGHADVLDGFRIVPLSERPRVTDGGAWYDDPEYDPNGEQPDIPLFSFNGTPLTWGEVEKTRPEEPVEGFRCDTTLPDTEGVRLRGEPQDERIARLLRSRLTRDEREVLRLVFDDGEDPECAARIVAERRGIDRHEIWTRLKTRAQSLDPSRYPVKALKAEFRRRGLSHRAIGDLLGVSRKTANGWLCGRKPLPARRYQELADLLDRGVAEEV